MDEKGSSENHQVNNLNVALDFAKYLGPITFYEIKNREQVVSFLNRKIKSSQDFEAYLLTYNIHTIPSVVVVQACGQRLLHH